MHSSTVNKEQFVTLDRAKWEHENTTQCIRCILVTFLFLFFFFHYCAVRRCDTISFITSFLGFSTFLFCSLSDLSTRPPLSIVLRSDEIGLRRASGALCFINSTSPLKDRPLTKLLFKGKKYTHVWGWRGFVGCVFVCVHVHVRVHIPTCTHARAWQYRKWSTPPQGWQIISLCHEASPCVQVISSEAPLLLLLQLYIRQAVRDNEKHIMDA